MATISVQFPGESVTLATRLPPLYFTEASPGSLELIASGGVAVSGTAPALLYEQETMSGGVSVGGRAYIQHDPLDVVGSGGVQLNGSSDDYSAAGGVAVSGSATVSNVNVRHWDEYGLGGIKASGAATDAWNWTTTVATGGVRVSGTATVSALTTLSGTLDATLPALTATLRQPYIDVVLPKMTVALGPEGSSSVITATLPAISASTNAVLGTIGVVDATMPALSADVGGGQFALDATLPKLSADITGTPGRAGVVTAALPLLSVSFAALDTQVGVMSASLPALTASTTGIAGRTGTVDVSLPKLSVTASGIAGRVGSVSASLPSLTAEMYDLARVFATMNVALPRMTVSLEAVYTNAALMVHVMNTITNAVTVFSNYDYDSFAVIDGKYIAAGEQGLVQLDAAELDVTDQITARFATGQLKLGSSAQKRLSDFYFAARSEGSIRLMVYVDDQAPYIYTLDPVAVSRLKQRRSLIGKGARGKYWQFAFENTNGLDFEFDSMSIAAVVTDRRI